MAQYISLQHTRISVEYSKYCKIIYLGDWDTVYTNVLVYTCVTCLQCCDVNIAVNAVGFNCNIMMIYLLL